MDFIKFGQNIKAQREARNLSQDDLSEQAGLSRKTIISIEKGDPSFGSTRQKILETLESIPVPKFMQSTPDQNPEPVEV